MTTIDRSAIFGTVVDGQVRTTEVGNIVREEWLRAPLMRPAVELDAYVIMPNHIHGIVVIQGHSSIEQHTELPRQFRSHSADIGSIVRGFKATTTRRINELRGTMGTKIWQRNYYDRIIRNEAELKQIRAYIDDNPLNWDVDQENWK